MYEGRFTVPAHVLARELEGECVLLDLRTEQYYGLDSVGTAMWTSLTDGPSIAFAREQLLTRFDVDAARLHADVDTFIDRLVRHGLAEVVRD